MKKFLVGLVLLALSACATFGSPETPNQKLYAAVSGYGVAVAAAADYAESPGANKAIVKRLDAAANDPSVVASLKYAQAWAVCKNSDALTVNGVNCTTFTFNDSLAYKAAIVIQGAASALAARK